MNNIVIVQWDEKKFSSSQDEWSELLARSDSDKLFMSWEWQYTWWNIFKDEENMSLRLLVAVDSGNKLVGIVPLFLSEARSKNILNTRRLQFIGNCWRGKPTMPTELLSFIVDKSVSRQAIKAFCLYINTLADWDEFVIPYLNKETETYQMLMSENLLKNCYYRCADEYKSYSLSLTDNFDSYVRSLGKNTRLKLFNRRKLAKKLGKMQFSNIDIEDIDEAFELLNVLHKMRWTKPVFKGVRLHFNKTVAKLMAKKKGVRFSILSVDGAPVSVQYNYIINCHEYNIQAGFDETFHKKISLGYLHFGFEIEYAFKNKIEKFDFLAGEGKKMQYKERLTKHSLDMVDLQIIRGALPKFLYRAYDLYKNVRKL